MSHTPEPDIDTEPGADTEPDPRAPSGPPGWSIPAPPSSAPGRGARQFLVGAVVGALVGGLAAGGVVALTDDDDGATTTRVVERVTPASQSNTSQFVEPADIQGVLAKIQPAVVAITTGSSGSPFGGRGAGTGFVISPDGVIVTNNHVVEGAGGDISVAFSDGSTEPAEVLGRDASIDLAVIKVDGENLATAALGDSTALQVGDDVVAIGNALALDGGPSVTQGIVSALNRSIQEQNGATLYSLIQTDAAINPGNSGGPLVNSRGEVVGINTAIANPNDAQNVGFAISISSVRDAIEQLRAGGKAEIPYMGVFTEPMTPEYATSLGSATETGALVRRVESGSGADDAGLEQNDIIVEVDGTLITGQDDVATAVREHRPGDSITVTFERDGERRTVEVQLGIRPES